MHADDSVERKSCCHYFTKRDGPHSIHSPLKPTQWIILKVAVLRNTGGDFRMSYLQEQSASAGQQPDHLPVDAPENGLGREKTIAPSRLSTGNHRKQFLLVT